MILVFFYSNSYIVADISLKSSFVSNPISMDEFAILYDEAQTLEENADEKNEDTPLIINTEETRVPVLSPSKDNIHSFYASHVEKMRTSVSALLRKTTGSRHDLSYRGAKIDDRESTFKTLYAENRYIIFLTVSQVDLSLDVYETALPPEVHQHILICSLSKDFPKNLHYFLGVLRQKDPTIPVVILSPSDPPHGDGVEDWAFLESFGGVYHVKGSPLRRRDLKSARAKDAIKAIILCDPFLYESGDLLADSPALLALLTLEEQVCTVTLMYSLHERTSCSLQLNLFMNGTCALLEKKITSVVLMLKLLRSSGQRPCRVSLQAMHFLTLYCTLFSLKHTTSKSFFFNLAF
jgi:hypothetical protein